MKVQLNAQEIAKLMEQAPDTGGDGGWQALLVGLRNRLDQVSGVLSLTDEDLERIPRYAFDYGEGGWESTLKSIFGRVLGTGLGR